MMSDKDRANETYVRRQTLKLSAIGGHDSGARKATEGRETDQTHSERRPHIKSLANANPILGCLLVLSLCLGPGTAVVAQTPSEEAAYLANRLARDDLGIWRTRTAWQRLEALGGAAVPAVVGLLDGERVQAATRLLGRIGHEDAIEPLIRTIGRGGATAHIAGQALGEIGGPAAVMPLIAVLTDPEREAIVRENAMRALGHIGDARAIDPIFEIAADRGYDYTYTAANALVAIGDSASALARLDAPDTYRRQVAAQVLSELGVHGAVPALLRMAGGSDYPEAQAAVEALGELGDPSAVEPLAELLRLPAPHRTSPIALIEALGRIGDPRAVDVLLEEGARSSFNHHVAEALGRIGDARAVDFLLELLSTGGLDAGYAAEALGLIGDARALGPLMETVRAELGSTDVLSPLERCVAALGSLGAPEAIPLLVSLVRRPGGRQATAALRALSTISQPALPDLMELLREGLEYPLDVRAADAIEAMRDEATVDSLVAALADPDAPVRGAAARALGELRAVSAIQGLVGLLGDSRRSVGFGSVGGEAADALVAIGAPAVEPLVAELGSAESAARDEIVRSLGELGDERAIEPLLAELRTGHAWVAREALAGFGPVVVDRMAELLDGDEPALRREAVEVLILVLRPMLFGLDSEAGALVVRSLDDPQDGVRATAVRALASLRDERTVDVLVTRLRDEDSSVRYYAISALSAVASPEAAAYLVPMLRDGNREVRYHVGAALAHLGDRDTDALLAAALAERDLRQVAAAHEYYILKGDPAAEEPLVSALETHGDLYMTITFRRSGNERLRSAAERWARERRVTIPPDFTGVPPLITWGRSN